MKVVLAGLLLLLVLLSWAGCGGDREDGEGLALYHLETAIGPPGRDGELRCGPPRTACPGVVEQPPPGTFHYAVLGAPALTDDDVEASRIRRAADPATGADVVIVGLTAEGRTAFARLTKEAARAGGRDQAWHHVAVVVGEEIVAFPEIDFDVHPDGIAGSRVLRIAAAGRADADRLTRLRGIGGG